MLDLTIFNNRLFQLPPRRAFLNGLARFALMFVFVFYFQGVQGDSPILAGLKLAPLAVGMLVASPLAGIYADRHGSRALAVDRDARDGARAGADDDARAGHAATGGRGAVHVHRRASARACSTRPTRRR